MTGPSQAEPRYAWLSAAKVLETIEDRFTPPAGFTRVAVAPGSFAEWLRKLPLRPPGTLVRLYDGSLKGRQDVHAAVIEIDVGRRDLQQCADAVMRLRAEYLFSRGRLSEISFNATSGEAIPFSRWAKGERASLSSNRLRWTGGAVADATHRALTSYLDVVFAYAGTHSLAKELRAVGEEELRIGDVFIKGGFPGHAVLVVDMAVDARGTKRALLAQSFMPAQDIHVLKDPNTTNGTDWYEISARSSLVTPEWIFPPGSLRRFKEK
ncbi:MAG: hypothetical protein F9K44_14710 [Hyphomicrobiaceae bacterium]|nr:MAG: hypothetical protein F9K44_14710 [Hyphomicrobiaceae bacterium]